MRGRYVMRECRVCKSPATFTVTGLAVELHKGHRERRVLRKVIGYYCEKCLKKAEFRFVGRDFLPGKERGQVRRV